MRVMFNKSNDTIAIPYCAEERSDGSCNHGYFDLKRQPDLINSIPELKGVPELMSLVRELNHSRSLVRSLSCEKAPGPNNDPFLRYKFTSFVRTTFEILNWNTEEKYRMLYDIFASGEPMATELVCVEFEVHPAIFRDHKKQGWAVTLWNHGYGRTEGEARDNWAIGVRVVEDFFSGLRLQFESELDRGMLTVS